MAVSGLTITSQRMTVVDFSQPFWYEPAAVVMQVSLYITPSKHGPEFHPPGSQSVETLRSGITIMEMTS